MKTKFVFFLSMIIFSCKHQEKIYLQKNLMNTVGYITYIDHKLGFISVTWKCEKPPYFNQPCYKFLEFPIYLFNDPQLGDTLYLLK